MPGSVVPLLAVLREGTRARTRRCVPARGASYVLTALTTRWYTNSPESGNMVRLAVVPTQEPGPATARHTYHVKTIQGWRRPSEPISPQLSHPFPSQTLTCT